MNCFLGLWPLFILASGCLDFFGDCPSGSPWVLTWEEPGIYDRFPNASAAGPWSIAVRMPTGLPFLNDSLDGLFRQYALLEIGWSPGEPTVGRTRGFTLTSGGSVSLLQSETDADPRVRDWFLSFAENLTGATPSTLEAWADAFVASRIVAARFDGGEGSANAYFYTHHLEPPYAIERAWERAAPNTTGVLPDAWGRYLVQSRGWTFNFELATKTATGFRESWQLALEVDPMNRTSLAIHGNQRPDEVTEQRLVVDAFQELGLGRPHPAEWRFQRGGPIC